MIFCNLFCELNSLSADLEMGGVGFDTQATRIANQLAINEKWGVIEKPDASVLEVKGRNGIHEVGLEIKP